MLNSLKPIRFLLLTFWLCVVLRIDIKASSPANYSFFTYDFRGHDCRFSSAISDKNHAVKVLAICGERNTSDPSKLVLLSLDELGGDVVAKQLGQLKLADIEAQTSLTKEGDARVLDLVAGKQVLRALSVNGDEGPALTHQSFQLILPASDGILGFGRHDRTKGGSVFLTYIDSVNSAKWTRNFDGKGLLAWGWDAEERISGGALAAFGYGSVNSIFVGKSGIHLESLGSRGELQNQKEIVGRFGSIALTKADAVRIVYDEEPEMKATVVLLGLDPSLADSWKVQLMHSPLELPTQPHIAITNKQDVIVAGLRKKPGNELAALSPWLASVSDNGKLNWSAWPYNWDTSAGTNFDIVCGNNTCTLIYNVISSNQIFGIRFVRFTP